MTQLFADALDGDACADDSLRRLAPHDTTAARAFEALVVVELERRFLSAAPATAVDASRP